MTPQQFIAKWQRANLSESSAAQQHFLDLCELLGQPKPAADPEGAWYTFERGVHKTGGGKGWADLWMREHFAWEYRGQRTNFLEAYATHFDQSSIRNPGTCRKSRRLRVTRIAPRSRTVAAMRKSILRTLSLSFLNCSQR